MMSITTEQTQALHDAYCKATKLDIKFTSYHMYVWERFIFDQHTQEELELVCKWLWHLVKKGERTMRTFAFQSLIRDEPRFLDDLAQARSWSRAPKGHNTDKAQVLKASGRAARTDSGDAQRIGSALNNLRAIEAGEAAFKAFKEAAKNL